MKEKELAFPVVIGGVTIVHLNQIPHFLVETSLEKSLHDAHNAIDVGCVGVQITVRADSRVDWNTVISTIETFFRLSKTGDEKFTVTSTYHEGYRYGIAKILQEKNLNQP